MPTLDLDSIKTLLTPPARRLVSEMKLQISEIALGDVVAATFVSPVFGTYVMSGNIRRASHDDLVLSIYSIETKGTPPADLVRLNTSGDVTAATGSVAAAPGLEHGSIVRATFTDRDSTITVLGPAVVASRAPMIGVGGWILAHKSTPGVRLTALDILAAPGEIDVRIPSPTISWHDV